MAKKNYEVKTVKMPSTNEEFGEVTVEIKDAEEKEAVVVDEPKKKKVFLDKAKKVGITVLKGAGALAGTIAVNVVTVALGGYVMGKMSALGQKPAIDITPKGSDSLPEPEVELPVVGETVTES